ncbi:DEAD/DEAH box helicase [Microbacterium gorillae]|uniref:DEAD/DEAH box helicase n=1 Tax=Microbacterium gorillae TaxID=1231063 RepID=UPI0005900681|nr:DEAD/DEAH box helicase [Microbacterium gorillae]
MPSSSDASGWRAQLGTGAARSDDERASLALLFQLRTLTRGGSQWVAPRAETARSVRPRGTQRLAVRPAVRSTSGNWVTAEVTWGDLPYRIERLRLDPRQVAWFGQFTALHRAGSEGYRASEADWLYLDDFASPLLWPALRGASDVGISLVAGKRDGSVTIGEASVAVDISPYPGSSALRLEPRVTVADAPVAVTGTIGDHGLYACEFEDGLQVTLATAAPADVAMLGWDRASLRVPAGEVAEFWRDHYPVLAHRVHVRGAGLDLPTATPRVVLIIEYRPRDVLLTRWATRLGSRLEPLPDPPFDTPARLSGADAAAFVLHDLPAIIAAEVELEEVGRRPDYRDLAEPPQLRIVAVPQDGDNDWFDFGFVLVIGEYTVALADVFRALSRGRDKLLMVDKTYLKLEHPLFDALRELIEDGTMLNEWETGARVPPSALPIFEPFQDESDVSPEALAWRRTAAALTDVPPPIDPPAGLHADLRPYQLDGFRWLAHLWEHRLGGILADDMGLGKTLQAIALIRHAANRAPRAERRPFLVVAPTSVVGAWTDEFARFAPELTVATVAATRDPIPDDVDVVLTSYPLLRLEADRFAVPPWDGLVLDEAQYVKNATAQVHEAAAAIRARAVYALSGTPMENTLLDLWAILQLVAPGMYASRIRFTDRYVKAHSAERVAELRRRLKPILLRRTKANVASELPDKLEQVVSIELSREHRALYERYLQRERQKLLGLVEDLDRNRFIVFRSLTLLRLLALDPRLIDAAPESAVPSAKLDELIDRIEDLAAEGHRALVFSQFTSFLALVRERLEARGVRYEYLDGSTRRRPEVIDRFRSGDAPVFLLSLKAGGVGLTITEADSVFLLDPWWNPAAESQAIDRTHRIGQTERVFVYRLVARDTIEEKVLALGERKRALFDEVIDDGDLFSGALTADEVRALLD